MMIKINDIIDIDIVMTDKFKWITIAAIIAIITIITIAAIIAIITITAIISITTITAIIAIITQAVLIIMVKIRLHLGHQGLIMLTKWKALSEFEEYKFE